MASEIVRIHEGNIDILSRLSEEEIAREREDLMSSVGQFLALYICIY